MQQFVQFINEAVTGVVVVLMVVAGLLSRYWDAPVFQHKGQTTDAKFARIIGLWLVILGMVFQVIKVSGRYILK